MAKVGKYTCYLTDKAMFTSIIGRNKVFGIELDVYYTQKALFYVKQEEIYEKFPDTKQIGTLVSGGFATEDLLTRALNDFFIKYVEADKKVEKVILYAMGASSTLLCDKGVRHAWVNESMVELSLNFYPDHYRVWEVVGVSYKVMEKKVVGNSVVYCAGNQTMNRKPTNIKEIPYTVEAEEFFKNITKAMDKVAKTLSHFMEGDIESLAQSSETLLLG
jgi:hypothetical protein